MSLKVSEKLAFLKADKVQGLLRKKASVRSRELSMSVIQGGKALAWSMRPVKDFPKNQVVNLILSAPLFEDMSQEDIGILARYLSLYDVDEGTVVFNEGDDGNFMGLIVEGIAELVKEGPCEERVKIGAEGAGRMLGEMALIDGEPRSATARFTQSGQILMLTKENFQRVISEHPKVAANFLFRLSRLLSQRLRRTTGMLSNYLSANTTK